MSLTPTLDLLRNLSTESIASSAPYIRDPELLAGIAKEKEAKVNALTENLLANDSLYQDLLKSYLNNQSELLMARAENAKLAEAQNTERAYKEALAHSATEKINRKDPVGYAETINQLANNLEDEEAAYTNAARSLLEEPEEDAIRNSTRDLLATSIEDILATDKAKQLDFAEYAYQNSLLGNNNIQYLNNLVRDTLRGKYGNGVDRRKALGKHYDAVQKEINRLYRK